MLALFDGCYWSIDKIEIEDEDGKDYGAYIEEIKGRRLSLYKSADICFQETGSLIDFNEIDFTDTLYKWIELKNKLELVHPMVLWSRTKKASCIR